MYDVINFNDWHIYEAAPIGSGRGEKDWLENKEKKAGLFKYPKIFSNGIVCGEHWAEKIASEIAKIIEIPCAEVDLGIYNNRIGAMSYLMLDIKNVTMVEGEQYIKSKYPHYDVNKLIDDDSKMRYSIPMIEEVLAPLKLFEEFLPIIVFDCLIGNTDRHQNNWGIIRNADEMPIKIARVYDNGSSLCCRIAADKVRNYLNDKNRFNALVDSQSKSRIAVDNTNKNPRHLRVLEYVRDHYYAITKPVINKIDIGLTKKAINDVVENVPSDIMCDAHKILVKHFLEFKREEMLKIYKC